MSKIVEIGLGESVVIAGKRDQTSGEACLYITLPGDNILVLREALNISGVTLLPPSYLAPNVRRAKHPDKNEGRFIALRDDGKWVPIAVYRKAVEEGRDPFIRE